MSFQQQIKKAVVRVEHLTNKINEHGVCDGRPKECANCDVRDRDCDEYDELEGLQRGIKLAHKWIGIQEGEM